MEKQDEIEKLRAKVILVAYDEPSLLAVKILRDLPIPYPLLIDRDKRAYAAWGLGRTGPFGAMLSPSLNWRYLRLLLKGERFYGTAPDMFQLGGDFVVDYDGTIKFAHRMTNNGDRASTAKLLDELASAATPRSG